MSEQLNILLADAGDVCATLEKILRGGGYQPWIRTVSSAEEFESALENGPVDVVIAGAGLCGFSAFSALKILQERRCDVPFVALTDTPSDRAASFECDTTPQRLLTVIQKQLDTRNAKQCRTAGAFSDSEDGRETITLWPFTQTESAEENHASLKSVPEAKDILDACPGFIYITDSEGRIIHANAPMVRNYGLSVDDLLGRTAQEFVPDLEIGQAMYHDDMDVLQRGFPGIEREERYIDGHGGLRWAWTVKRPLINPQGHITHMIAVSMDITNLKRLEESLAESEQLHRMTLSMIADVVFLTDDDGVFVWISENAERTFGYSREEILRMERIQALLGPGLPDIGQLETEEEIRNIETVGYTRQGEERILLISVRRVTAGNGTVLYTCRDITDRIRAKTQERQREFQYRQLFNTMLNGFALLKCLYNPAGEAENYLFIDINPAFERLTRLNRRQVIGQTIRDIFPNIDSFWIMALDQASSAERPIHVEHMLQQDNRCFDITAYRPQAGQVAILFSDITETRRAETERKRFFTIIEQAVEGIIITDKQGVIEYVNPGFEQMTGYRCTEITGKTLAFLHSGHHDEKFYERLWHALRQGRVWKGRFMNRRRNGELFQVECSISPVRDSTGEIENYIGVQRDITIEARLEGQLRHSQRLETVGQLAGGIAHDFNNLLQGILGYSELMLAKAEAGSQQHRHLTAITQAAGSAAALTRKLLVFSRQQTMEYQLINLNETVQSLSNMLCRILGARIELTFDADPDLPYILADPGQLDQLLMNLCVNARDAMPDGGEIRISTEVRDVDTETAEKIIDLSPDRYVLLKVTDTGCGIPEDVRQHIFEPFFSTKDQDKGTGLGLAMVYGIIRQHNGAVQVDSREGKGTCFSCWLPITEKPAVVKAGAEAGPSRDSVLLITEGRLDQEMLGHILETAGYRVDTTNKEHALTFPDSYNDAIRLVIMDYPVTVSQRELISSLRKRLPEAVFLLLTHQAGVKPDTAFIALNEAETLDNPFEPAALLRCVRRILREEGVI